MDSIWNAAIRAMSDHRSVWFRKNYMAIDAQHYRASAHPPIASICSQMPDMTIPQVNVAAARDTTSQTSRQMHLFERYAVETADPYCAGCGYICEPAEL